MTDIPDLIPIPGTIVDIAPPVSATPYTPSWWQTMMIADIPETSVGWLLAQGWQIVKAVPQKNGPTTYVMACQKMQQWAILQALLNDYVNKYNHANNANWVRYGNIVDLWNNMIHKTREQLNVQGDHSDVHLTAYLSHVDILVDSVEDEMGVALQAGTDASLAVAAQLQDYVLKLNQLDPLYNQHKTKAEGLLDGLGATELARINEQFDNAKATALQALTNRGLYSSAIVTAVEARIERERNEAISALNDRLAREKLENEHRLFEQALSTTTTVLDGKLKLASAQHQQGQYISDLRLKCANAVMQARMTRIQGLMDVRDKENALMSYQLETRNNLSIGLLGFVERREDVGPSMEDMTKLIVGLGDSGGGWLSPD